METRETMLFLMLIVNQLVSYGVLIAVAFFGNAGEKCGKRIFKKRGERVQGVMFSQGSEQDMEEKHCENAEMQVDRAVEKKEQYLDYINKFEVEV